MSVCMFLITVLIMIFFLMNPQGIYKLVVLAEEGHDVPLIIRDRLNISIHDGLDIVVERLLQRYFPFYISESYQTHHD